MNFTPNFEQFKRDEEKLEKIPTIKAEFYFVMNDICKKILENKELSNKDINDLEMVFNMTQDLERELINNLDKYRAKKIITTIDFLLASDYFLTANQNGPESSELKNELMNVGITKDEYKTISEKISIPEDIRNLLVVIYSKIIDSKGFTSS